MIRLIAVAALVAFASGDVAGQPGASFEVASIRLNKSSGNRGDMDFPPGGERFRATNVSLGILILTAYNVTVQQCSCQNPAFPVLSERFDVQAKAGHPVKRDEMLRLLQSLLEDRFQLVVRREKKELPAYALVVEQAGPRLHVSDAPHSDDDAPLNPYRARGLEPSAGYLVFKDETMADFAWRLSTLAILGGRVVVDKTGLDGRYDFDLKFAPDSPDADGPSIFTAIRDQLGLRLAARKISLEVLSVERAEKSTDN